MVNFYFEISQASPSMPAVINSPASRQTPIVLSENELPHHLQEANRAFQGIPGIEGAANGRLWATWYGGGYNEGVDNAVFMATSESLGEAWKFVLAVDTPGNVRGFDPCLWMDPQGRLWLFWAQAVPHGESPFVWAMVTENPDAQDAKWSAPFEICPGVMMNKPTVLSSGVILLPVSNWKRERYHKPPEDVTAEVYALDLSTRKASFLGGAKSEQEVKCFDEHMLVELRDGRVWMLVRTRYGIGESFSQDGGETWSAIQPSKIQHTNSRFYIRRLVSGNLILVKHGPSAGDVGRTHLQVLLSKDDGATWIDGLLLDERPYASYPDGFQDAQGRIHVAYDFSRMREKEILCAVFREDEIEKRMLIHADSRLGALINKSFGKQKEAQLLPAQWDAVDAGNEVMRKLIKVTPPPVKGAHDAEMTLVGDHAYIVSEVNEVSSGESDRRPEIYALLSIVNIRTMELEAGIPFAKSEQVFENETLPVGACFVPRIIQKDDAALRCYFSSVQPDHRQSQVWFRDFDIGSRTFENRIYRAMLKTADGVFPMQPQYFHADAARLGFSREATDSGLYIFDAFKKFDEKLHVGINNFPGRQNALALVHDDLVTFEVIGHFNQPETLSEHALNRLPDGTWLAICRQEGEDGNYLFSRSPDGVRWTVAEPLPFVANGEKSKPTFDRFGDLYYLGWQENTRIDGVLRSVFNVDISRDCKTWERKYRFETKKTFQYPAFRLHDGAIWLCVTQGDAELPAEESRKKGIMFGKLEDL